MEMKNKKIPVFVLNGFLGSGKTTVLINLLTYCKEKGLKAGVILNELGESNVEGHLLGDENIVELLNGCICCTIQDDLRNTFDDFLRNDNYVDLLFIEGTGVANPIEVIEALMDPTYIEQFDLQSVIGVVDASQYSEYQSIFSSSKEVRKLLQDQIKYSNVLLLNKIDLLSTVKVDKIEKQIRKTVSSDVPIIHTVFTKVEMEELMKKRFSTMHLKNTDRLHECGHHHEPGESCSHTHSHSNHSTIKAIKLDRLPKFNRMELEKWLLALPATIFRSKGIIQFDETPGYFDFQFASKQIQLQRLSSTPRVSPCIVLIGIDFDEEQIIHSFSNHFKLTSINV
jgi:G3E family GTPase